MGFDKYQRINYTECSQAFIQSFFYASKDRSIGAKREGPITGNSGGLA